MTDLSAAEILSKLVSFPVLGGMPNLSIIDWIEDYLKQNGIASVRVPSPDEPDTKACLHARIGPAVDGGWILSGHTDVVPVEGQAWDTDPFTLIDKADRLYARGSCDMKGFLACALSLVPYFKSLSLKKPIYFAFSFDEEIGCLSGDLLANAIRTHYTERPAYCIVGEATMLRPVAGQKGIVVYKVVVQGSAGHSSRIRSEVSAVHEAAKLIVWLEEKMEALITAGQLDDRFEPPHSSLHAGQVHGGSAHNIVADEAWFTVDLRTIPSDSEAEILADFQAFAKTREEHLKTRFAGTRIEIKPYHPSVPPLDTPADSSIVPIVQALAGTDELLAVSYASEAGQFANAGFETIICGPGDIAQAHRANEFVAKSQLSGCVDMLKRLGTQLAD